MRPGSTVDLAPVLTNNGDINTTVLMRVMVPVVNGVSAYDYEVSSSWTRIQKLEYMSMVTVVKGN